MARKLQTHRQVLAGQIISTLRAADGDPLTARDIARRLGDHLVVPTASRPKALPRPACWPDDVAGEPVNHTAWCQRCWAMHRAPVWRSWSADDLRPLLQRLERQGQAARIVLPTDRAHYWYRPRQEPLTEHRGRTPADG